MKKRNKKIIIGWILVALQCMAVIGTLAGGHGLPTGIANGLGFFSFSIVGAILLYLGYHSNDNKESESDTYKDEKNTAENNQDKSNNNKNETLKNLLMILAPFGVIIILIFISII